MMVSSRQLEALLTQEIRNKDRESGQVQRPLGAMMLQLKLLLYGIDYYKKFQHILQVYYTSGDIKFFTLTIFKLPFMAKLVVLPQPHRAITQLANLSSQLSQCCRNKRLTFRFFQIELLFAICQEPLQYTDRPVIPGISLLLIDFEVVVVDGVALYK